MLKQKLVKIVKAAVLASLIVSTVVVGGCQIDVEAKTGHWYYWTDTNGVEQKECRSGGTECALDVSISVSS